LNTPGRPPRRLKDDIVIDFIEILYTKGGTGFSWLGIASTPGI
jgi:hypothetical protein